MSEFIMMIGLPGSGKSTFVKNQFPKNVVLSSDQLREELFGHQEQGRNQELFNIMNKRAKKFLENGQSVVYDATNISWKRRRELLRYLGKATSKKTAIMVMPRIGVVKERNQQRERKVPNKVIDKMWKSFDPVHYFEGWDEIHIVDTEPLVPSRRQHLSNAMARFDQNTPHHKQTLMGHSLSVSSDAFEQMNENSNLVVAALCHDVGKLYTGQYDKEKDKNTYYNHHHVSAYEFLSNNSLADTFGQKVEDIVEVAFLINFHMAPYTWKLEKTKQKYRKIFGEELYNKLMALHQMDKNGKE